MYIDLLFMNVLIDRRDRGMGAEDSDWSTLIIDTLASVHLIGGGLGSIMLYACKDLDLQTAKAIISFPRHR